MFFPKIVIAPYQPTAITSDMINRLLSLAIQKLSTLSLRKLYSTIAKNKAGQKTILRCSHVLSLAAAIIATGFQKLLNSKAKCKKVPITTINKKPEISQPNINFFK